MIPGLSRPIRLNACDMTRHCRCFPNKKKKIWKILNTIRTPICKPFQNFHTLAYTANLQEKDTLYSECFLSS